MSISRPYRRTCRQFVDGSYPKWQYITHPKFAQSPDHYVRALLLLLKDLQELFDYVEPADRNLACYSYRIHALLLRACIEVEANCKAILKENGYQKPKMNIGDYRKIEATHQLASYQVRVPSWSGDQWLRTPFSAWATPNEPLPWYEAYNATKHDRHHSFAAATFEHLLDASCGLLVLLSSQFNTYDFPSGDILLSVGRSNDSFESGIGSFFRVKFPSNWPMEQRYEFNWQELEDEEDPFITFDYTRV